MKHEKRVTPINVVLFLVVSMLAVAVMFVCTGCEGLELGQTNESSAETKAKTNHVVNSKGLAYISNGDGSCYVSGIGSCTDTEVVISPMSPDGDRVTGIGEQAFSECKKLTSVTIPNTVTIIENMAFDYCTGLTSITIPDSVTSIGIDAFSGCRGLTSITIPQSVTSIGSNAFFNCTGLMSITIPDSVTSIGRNAFGWIPNVVYHGSLPDAPWGAKAMNGYVENEFVYRDASKTTLLASGGCGTLIIPDSVTSIGDNAFAACTGLISITIPDSVTSIGIEAFSGCRGLTSFTIGNSVTSIGACAFYGCTGLTSITIPDSVTDIGDGAFWNCTGLTSITIPDSVTSIGRYAFEGCRGLTSITIGNSVKSIGSEAFRYCYKLIEVCNKSKLSISTGSSSYGDVGYHAEHIITDEKDSFLTTKDNYIFYEDGTNSYLMGYVGNKTDLVLPQTTPTGKNYSIYKYAFYKCTGLTSITIPDSVTSIGDSAFSECTGLTSITIPDSVTSIGEDAFRYCTNLTIYCEASEKPKRWSPSWKESSCPVVWGYTGD